LDRGAIADEIGVTPQAVSQWMCGTHPPSTPHLQSLAEILGISMERFWGVVPKKKRGDS
jgi:transcriptional regulator with XRE-family HTH domain